MVIKSLISGFFVKAITGIDDTVTQIPLISTVTYSKIGKIAYSLGVLLAISLAVVVSFLFASAIKQFEYSRYIAASLVFFLALLIYFDIFIHAPKKKAEQKIKKLREITNKRFLKLIGIGFIAAFVTVIDDTIAYSSVLLGKLSTTPFVIAGIFLATFTELFIIVYFSKIITKFKYKKQVAVSGLIILSFLILFEVF